ncbi:MAG: UbiA family prenyltransferase [Flavobacteriales bacterium]|nr:UbiA family prenyltransferase [Flavobacteriales bacterium]
MDYGIRNPVLRSLMYGHAWLALGAALQVWWIGRVFFVADTRVTVAIGCGTFAIYGLIRLFRLPGPPQAGAHHLIWFRENKKWMIVLIGLAMVASGLAILPLLGELWPALGIPGIISLLYVLPMEFTHGRIIGLRRIPFMKSLWISLVWAAVSVLVPASLDQGPRSTVLVVLLFIMQTTFIYSLMIPFDMRDRPFDLVSLRTVPQVLGDRAARIIAVALGLVPVLISGFFAFHAYAHGMYVLPYALSMLGFAISAALVARASDHRSEAYYLVWLDGTLVLVASLGLLGTVL